tara:strand:- start:191 stop:676 length:486 start_codon:yes stop_codon:yes gene_type:complete
MLTVGSKFLGKYWGIGFVFAALISAAQRTHAENENVLYDWTYTLGEWSNFSGDGIVQLGAVRQSLEEPRQSLTLTWLSIDRVARSFNSVTSNPAVEICGKEAFQNVEVVSVFDSSPSHIDLALRVRFLPANPEILVGNSRLIFVVLNKGDRNFSVLNCRVE